MRSKQCLRAILLGNSDNVKEIWYNDPHLLEAILLPLVNRVRCEIIALFSKWSEAGWTGGYFGLFG